LDQTKDSLTRQLASLSVNNEQKQTELTDAISERDLLKQEIIKEQSKIENLEVLLSNERRKDYHSQLTTEEKDKELHHLRQQLTRLENDKY
jgi:centrosomal protein CEP135